MEAIKYSIVVPVYKNEDSVQRLLEQLTRANELLKGRLEVVFVVDGSPDASYERLKSSLPTTPFASQLLAHSRNFGSFLAIRNGLLKARGNYYCVMAADLQEPITLAVDMFELLAADKCDITVGQRVSRDDPALSRLNSEIFWWLYRKLVVPEMPKGGVDVFGCNKIFRDKLLELEESRSSLVALIFWLGFRRESVNYKRQRRLEGKSAWTLKKKLGYLSDSICSFTDLPIRLLVYIGTFGIVISLTAAIVVTAAKFSGMIEVSGYTATILAISFFGAINLLSTGVIGTYAWRAYENTKNRPLGIIARETYFPPHPKQRQEQPHDPSNC
ncbi:MAG: glycosyltransferase [Rubripirellula sp.]